MSKRREDDLAIGEDAFMDTIANLVGIIIILIVIVSAGTNTAARVFSEKQAEEASREIEQPLDSAVNIQKDLVRQIDQLQQHNLEVAYRNAEREVIMRKVLIAKQMIEDEKAELDDATKADIAAQQSMNEMERKLAELQQQQGDNHSRDKPVVILKHLPTPMAKTVFGKEMHIMVRNNQVSVIPWDRLVDMLKTDARTAVNRSSRKERIVDKLGPVEGYIMEYTLVSKRGMVSNGSSTAMAQMIELDKFELEPTSEIMAETLQQSLSISGRLRAEMSAYIPQQTTITAWVYPDSFEMFRQLKELLYQEGFMTAARPMPEGFRIGASPRGAHSSAQ